MIEKIVSVLLVLHCHLRFKTDIFLFYLIERPFPYKLHTVLLQSLCCNNGTPLVKSKIKLTIYGGCAIKRAYIQDEPCVFLTKNADLKQYI